MNDEDPAVTDFYARFGALVAERRRERAITQDKVAEVANLTRSSVANLEAGRQRIPLDGLARIGRQLDLDVVAALSGETPLPDVRTERAHNAERARQRATLGQARTLIARVLDEIDTVQDLLDQMAERLDEPRP